MSTSSFFAFAMAAFKAVTVPTSTATSSAVQYASTDLLGSVNVVTNAASGTVIEALHSFPFGQVRTDATVGYGGQKRKYIGEEYDAQTQLSYLNARYYNGSQGQFSSEDPMFLGNQSQQNLSDPQSLNAYSYSEDSPIIKSDPTGRIFGVDDAIEAILIAGGTIGSGECCATSCDRCLNRRILQTFFLGKC